MLQFNFKNNLKESLENLKKLSVNIQDDIRKCQEEATLIAIETATRFTPPRDDDDKIRGTGTITGDLKSSWAKDSVVKSYKKDKKFITVLANSKPYASFVNDGHRMSKHFVPGLMINPFTGLLEKAPDGMNTGIMVGTKTTYVQGIFMKEWAIEMYKDALKKSIDLLIEDYMK